MGLHSKRFLVIQILTTANPLSGYRLESATASTLQKHTSVLNYQYFTFDLQMFELIIVPCLATGRLLRMINEPHDFYATASKGRS